MRLSILASAFVAYASATAAFLPQDVSESAEVAANEVPVGYGQELQNTDQANHWVVWVEGKSACPAAQVLGRLTGSPCNQEFKLNGYSYHFTNCNSKNEPGSVVYKGKKLFDCKTQHDKINCHGSQHDIVKHGYCK